MPEMNGIEFVRNLRATRAKETLPVIMVTTEGGGEMVNTAMELGANGYVCKPFTPESIRSALEPFVS